MYHVDVSLVCRGGGHEREISNAGRSKLDFTEIDQCKLVLLGLSLAGNLVKPLLSLYETEWRERGYGLRAHPLFFQKFNSVFWYKKPVIRPMEEKKTGQLYEELTLFLVLLFVLLSL